MSFLRRIRTRSLLALCATGLVVAAGVAAAALAAAGGGPTPAPKPLAEAVHAALGAPAVQGVSARIAFTNHLIDSASLEGSDPILTGAHGRLWAAGARLRLELQADGGAGDAQVLVDGDRIAVYDAGSGTVYRATLPKRADRRGDVVPSLARIEDALTRLAQHAMVSSATPGDVAGRPAYTVRVAPRHDGGLLGGLELAWDAEHGIPLRAAVYARGGGGPVLELRATDIAFGAVPASTFAIPQPAGAKVVDLSPSPPRSGAGSAEHAPVTGLSTVQPKVPFAIAAPDRLVGLPRREVRLVELDGTPGALVTYGQGLGGIAVLQTRAGSRPAGPLGGDGAARLTLPRISIGGISGQELDTALGTVVRFDRGGVSYTVLGSVPPAAAEAAARGL